MGSTEPTGWQVAVEQAGDELVLRRRTASSLPRGPLLRGFLRLWLALWSIGCVGLLLVAVLHRSPQLLLMACPALAAWAFVLQLLTGRERLRIGPGGLDYS